MASASAPSGMVWQVENAAAGKRRHYETPLQHSPIGPLPDFPAIRNARP
jgi:hypothetical protein